MNIVNLLNKYLKYDITFIELIVYFSSSFIILFTILYSIYYYFVNIKNTSLTALELKIKLGNTLSLALSFILSVEILKIYYVKTYKQLVIISVLVVLKLTINYFLTIEIEDAERDKKDYVITNKK
jgi:uncharacterized membrane protein